LGAYLCFLGFWGFSLSFGFPLFLWASWVVPLYTSCILRALYAFFNKIFLLIKKKEESSRLCPLLCTEGVLNT